MYSLIGSGVGDAVFSLPVADVVTLPENLTVIGNVVRNATGEEVPSQRLSTGALAFLAKDVPALTATRFTFHAGEPWAPASAYASGATLTNVPIALRLNEKTGAIASLTWKELGVELVDGNADLGLNRDGSNRSNPHRPSTPT